MGQNLIYIKHTCTNNDGTYEYDFYFSEEPNNVWGVDWDIENPLSCDNTDPEESTYNEIKHVTTTYKLKTAQETTCFSLEYATHGILALAWIDIENLEEYPENGRMVFHFNDSKEKVIELLSLYDFKLE